MKKIKEIKTPDYVCTSYSHNSSLAYSPSKVLFGAELRSVHFLWQVVDSTLSSDGAFNGSVKTELGFPVLGIKVEFGPGIV